jgi:serine phosphatase RsbU (regulator of sigma subunit)/predicted enzyme related to lactoylglutathione lyase
MAKEQTPGYLRLQAIVVPVADIDRSLAFYETQLGFKNIQGRLPAGMRIRLVAPPDGDAILVLSESDPDHRLGTATGVSFLTDDIDQRHREWAARGVVFTDPPHQALSGTRTATFVDIDRNTFQIIEADFATQQLEAARRAAAERADRERRAAHELVIATQVQAGLLPRERPPLKTLDYAGVCLQARQVGGDYFDFLDFGDGRLGLAIGDVSGKGLGAALLMANLQAHLRGQFARFGDDLPGLLLSVNRLFLQSAPSASYATLFVGVYDDRTRQLRFVNCGHPAPLLLRREGSTQRLAATGWVVGMFDEWKGTSRDVTLLEGDILALYTDGVTETVDSSGEEFGEKRLAAALERHHDASSPTALADDIIAAVQEFGAAEQFDDITVIVGLGK